MKKRTTLHLVLLFAGIFILKSLISFFMKSPFIFSDEACVIQKAIYFINNFKLESCTNILSVPAGDPQPLYSILISPIYLFLSGTSAYHAILILNSLLLSSLVFPLFSIFKRFLKNNKIIFLNIVLILFLPQVVAFDKSLMTETLFIVINIWFLHFYLKSFDKNKKRTLYKSIAVLLSVLAVLTRPFGFIVPIALVINEIINYKNRRNLALFYIPLMAILVAFTISYFMPHIPEYLDSRLEILRKPNAIIEVIYAIKNQINSFTIATFFIPIIIFFSHIFTNKSKDIKNVRYLVLSLIAINFFISAQHAESYTYDIVNSGIVTRYINISIIYILLFALIFLYKFKKSKFNKSNIIASVILITSLFLLDLKAKLSLNLDISIYFDTSTTTVRDNLVSFYNFLIIPIYISYFVLFLLFIKNKRKILKIIISAFIIINSILCTLWTLDFADYTPDPLLDITGKETKILYLQSDYDPAKINVEFWKLLVLSENDIKFGVLEGIGSPYEADKIPQEIIDGLTRDFDYIITPLKLNLPTPKIFGQGYKKENFYDLTKL